MRSFARVSWTVRSYRSVMGIDDKQGNLIHWHLFYGLLEMVADVAAAVSRLCDRAAQTVRKRI